MFGYATNETEECMPLTVVLAHKLNEKLSELRRNGTFWWARPDTKTQVSRHFCKQFCKPSENFIGLTRLLFALQTLLTNK